MQLTDNEYLRAAAFRKSSRHEFARYRTHCLSFWLSTSNDDPKRYARDATSGMVWANWEWAGREGVRDQIVLTDAQREQLLAVLIERNG